MFGGQYWYRDLKYIESPLFSQGDQYIYANWKNLPLYLNVRFAVKDQFPYSLLSLQFKRTFPLVHGNKYKQNASTRIPSVRASCFEHIFCTDIVQVDRKYMKFFVWCESFFEPNLRTDRQQIDDHYTNFFVWRESCYETIFSTNQLQIERQLTNFWSSPESFFVHIFCTLSMQGDHKRMNIFVWRE